MSPQPDHAAGVRRRRDRLGVALDLIETWVDLKCTNEIPPIAQPPHPNEFEPYYDV